MTSTMRLTTAIALYTFALVGSASFASADPYKVGATTYSRSFEFYQDIEKGMKEAGGDKVVFDFRDPNGDLAAQTAQIEDFVSKKVDLVTIVPIDSTASRGGRASRDQRAYPAHHRRHRDHQRRGAGRSHRVRQPPGRRDRGEENGRPAQRQGRSLGHQQSGDRFGCRPREGVRREAGGGRPRHQDCREPKRRVRSARKPRQSPRICYRLTPTSSGSSR